MKFLFFVALFPVLLVSCQFNRERIKGNGRTKSEVRTAANFNVVDVSGNFDVYTRQDSAFSVSVEADENLMEYIEVSTEGEKLVIRTRNGVNLSSRNDLKVYISSPAYSSFHLSGSCEIIGENKISVSGPLKISLNGASDIKLEVTAPSIEAGASGAGRIELIGETKTFTVDGSGSTTIKCNDLLAETVDVEISGSGSADVFASVKLDVRISGSGEVRYRGNAVVSKNISGAGSVTKQD